MALGLPSVFPESSFAPVMMLKQECGPSQPDGQITESCLAPFEKIFCFSADPNHFYNSRRPVPTRGALRGRHGRWERDAMDAAASGTQVLDE
jgi:hypothetical protein